MINLPAALITQKNLLSSSDAWLLLVELTLTDGNIFRLVRNTEDIFFASDNYSDVGCIAHWKMNDSLPTTNVIDSSPNGNDGTANRNTSLMTAAGKVNEALDFNGTSDEIQIPEFSICNSDTNRSISFWVKAASGQSQEYPRFYQGTYNFYSFANAWGNVGGICLFRIYDGAGNWGDVSIPNEDLFTDTWHHVVITVSRDIDEMKAYLDGVLIDTSDISGVGDTSGSVPFFLGSAGGNYYLDGSMDDVRIYNRTLAADEISAIYNSGNGTEQLLARYTAFGFEVEPTQQNASGEIPTVTLRTCNVTRYLQPYIEDLDGGIGSIVKLTVVNTNQLEEDYSEVEMEFEILESESDVEWIIFILGAPNPLRKRFPLNRYFAGSCRWKYRDSDNDISIECNYAGKSISGIANTNPCQITANSHGLATGNEIFLEDIVDDGAGTLEDALNDLSFEIIVVDSNTFSVPVDATGLAAYSSGGTSGYNECKRTLEDCANHENEPRYGGIWGLTQGGALIA